MPDPTAPEEYMHLISAEDFEKLGECEYWREMVREFIEEMKGAAG